MIYYNGITYRDVKLGNFAKYLGYFNKYLKGKKDCIPLITCNRIEVYSIKPLRLKGFRRMEGRKAIKHLFRVCAGLDSMIIGENEIALQVKEACEKNKNKEINRLFERALKTAKKIRSHTKINHGRVSIASIAVETALSRYKPNKVLIIGSGMLARKIAKALSRKKIEEIILSNRHFKRAKRLARQFNGKAERLDNLKKILNSVNVVFSTTSCPKPVIYKEDIPNSKIILFDLAVPSDVDKMVGRLRNVEIIRLESFKKILNENKIKKRKEVKKAMEIIEDELKRL